MSHFREMPQHRSLLFVQDLPGASSGTLTEAIHKCEQILGRKLRIIILTDTRTKSAKKKNYPKSFIHLTCDTSSMVQLQKTLLPYQDDLLAIICRGERNIPIFSRIIPHVPYLRTPTTESLEWATEKILMRRRLTNYNRKITPAYTVVSDASDKALAKIEKKVGFPLIVKPSGLASSLLVSICYHPEELEKVLKMTFRKMRSVYKASKGRGEPRLLVEQFMEGEMYSVDAYVTSRGGAYMCPLVHIKTGRSIGFDDFFGYQQLTPADLKASDVKEAQVVAGQGIKALGLRSTTAHVELMRTRRGWKIIEIGPRVGGFRPELYKLSYGIDHILNDILIRIPKKPIIPQRQKGYAVAMKFYAKREGIIESIKGIKKVRTLESFNDLKQHKQRGDSCKFAKHGGTSIFDIFLFNTNHSRLQADIRRVEQTIKIAVSSKKKPSKFD